ncbi:MAG: histidine--tRNA ligase [Rickettsiales bacterium]|nr:histidine--tRNA ligase [Rickettsiales bacterium]|tara:strand:- start:42159 stop:43388 length:1230 start_codon:yes stop_codon:yes gene_type:complete
MVTSLRGMPDIYPEETQQRDQLTKIFTNTAFLHGFHRIETPILESLDVFVRSVGETSDIVSKEMYTLKDKGERDLCLRPENTAGIIRSILNNKKSHIENQKYFYYGPMFRYERPQKGRLRQFSQLGIEYINAKSPTADVESIILANDFIKNIGITDYTLELNTLGDEETRKNHKKALVEYLSKHQQNLSKESQDRLQKNPLRILDSKDEKDIEICQSAPLLVDFLSKSAQDFFDRVVNLLNELNIYFNLNPYLVRGLDYYSHTIFEFKSGDLGSQSTFLAGGRYDKLSQLLGGRVLPSVGWAAGLERLMLISNLKKEDQITTLVIPGDESLVSPSLSLVDKIRSRGITSEVSPSTSFKSGLKYANKNQVNFAVLLGAKEQETNTVTWKNLLTGSQHTNTLEEFIKEIKK